MTSSSRFVAAATCVAFVASSSAALAQENHGAPLRLESDTPHTEYKVYAGKKASAPWFECLAPCTYAVPPGEYRIEASGPEMSSGKTVTTVTGDTRVIAHGGSSDAKTAGLVLAIAGSAAAFVGMLGYFANSCFMDSSTMCENQHATARTAYGVTFLAGAALTVVGWVTFAANRTKLEATPTFAPRVVSVGVAPTSGGGAAIGALGTF